MSSKRSVSVCSRSPKFYSENQNSRLLFSSTCSTTSHISKSPFETAIYSQDDIQGSSAILAAELDKLILVNAGLTKEIGTWKRKYKECYRLLEHHLPTDNENEGNSEYKQKYEKLKGKANELKKGFKTLENIVIEKNQEIESWSLKYSQMEQEYIDQIQNLRNQIEIVLKTQIEKEVNLAFSAFEKEKASREEDWAGLITKLNQSQVELRFVSEEKEQALRKLEEVKGKLEGVSSMEKEYKTLNEGYEKAVRQLDEVREQLAAKEVNCKSIQNKCTMMGGEIDKLRNSVKEQTTKCVVAQKELNCLSEEKEKIGKELEQVREQLKIVEKNYKDAQCKYILRSEEAERLKSGEGERDARVGKLSEELVMLNREQERLVGELEDVKAELIIEQDKNSQLKAKMEEKNRRMEEIEENLMVLREEKDRTVRELEEVRQQLVISEEKQENKMKSVESLYRNEKEKMKHEISELQEMVEVKEKAIIRLEEEMRVKESQQRVYQDKVLAQQGELIIEQDQNSQLKEKMEEKNRRMEDIEESLVVLREEKDRTVRELEEVRQQLAISEEKQENKMKSVESLYRNEKEKMKHEILELQEMIEVKEKAIISLEGEMRVKESQQRVYQDKVLAQQGELQLMQDNILMLNQEIALGKTAQTLHTCELRRRDEALESVKHNLKGEVEQKERLEQEVMRLEMEKSKVTKEKEALVEENLALVCLRDKAREHEETLKALRKEKSDLKARLEMTEKESIESLKNSDKSIEQYEKRIQALIERNGALAGEMEELKLRVEEFSLEMEGKEDLKIRLVKNEIFLQEMTRLLGVNSDKIVGKIEEILKEIARLSKENVSLKSSLGQGEESRGVLEGRLKDLEASWEQLKVCLGEEKAEEMVKKIEGYKREMKRVNCEAGVLKKRYEDQEMKNIQEIDRVRCETENMWKKRMEAEVESKKLIIRHMEEEMTKERSEHESRVESEMKRNEDYEKQIKELVEKNEKANARVSQLVQEIEASKLNFEEEKVMESRLTGLKFELEKERRAQQEKEFVNIENQWKEKVSFHEGQAKNWKAKVEDFEMRQVLYFIEIERLFGINAGLIADVNKLTLELRDSSMELEKNRKMLLEATKIDSARSDQRDQFDEVARDLTKQIEGLERKFQSHFKEKEQDDGLAMETPVKEISRFGERRSKRGQYSSIHKSHAELRDLAMKFESEKKTMENQLAQLKKIVDMNKSEMKRMNQDNMLQDLNNQRSPSIKFGDDQSRPSYLGSDIRPKSPFQSHNGSQFYTSAGKENVKNIPSLSLTKSASHSVLGFKNGSLQREDDSSLYPKVSVFKY